MRKSVVGRRLGDLLMRAELPPMRFHDLRHACASLLLVQGVHPRVSCRARSSSCNRCQSVLLQCGNGLPDHFRS
jgi:integrase